MNENPQETTEHYFASEGVIHLEIDLGKYKYAMKKGERMYSRLYYAEPVPAHFEDLTLKKRVERKAFLSNKNLAEWQIQRLHESGGVALLAVPIQSDNLPVWYTVELKLSPSLNGRGIVDIRKLKGVDCFVPDEELSRRIKDWKEHIC